jgi:hypothetical protein
MYQNSKNIEKIAFFTLTHIDAFVASSSFDVIKKGRHSEARVFEMVCRGPMNTNILHTVNCLLLRFDFLVNLQDLSFAY